MNKKFAEYCNQYPEPVDIKLTDDGFEYIPIQIIQNYLDELCNEIGGTWCASGTYERENRIEGDFKQISGELLLEIAYYDNNKNIVRVSRPGSSTIILSTKEPTPHYAATLKSEAIKNAAKTLGRRFGRFLNDKESLSEGQIINAVKKEIPPISEEDKKKITGHIKNI